MQVQNIAQLIAKVESDNDPFAIRFEPAHVPESQFVSQMMETAKCSEATAKILCSCSFGLFQIMGDNLLWLGMTVSPIAFCYGNFAQQSFFFQKFLEFNNINYSLQEILLDESKRLHFAQVYNGNAEAYAERMIRVYNAS